MTACGSLQSFRALVGEVVLVRPGLTSIGRGLTELSNTICAEIIEAQPARERLAIRLRHSVSAEVHHAVHQASVKVDHVATVVDPELLPALEVDIVDVVALTRVPGLPERSPVLPDDAVADRTLDVAVAGWSVLACRDDIPVTQPEVKLAVFAAVVARRLIPLGLSDERREAGIATQAHEVWIGAHQVGAAVPLSHRIGKGDEGLVTLTHRGECDSDAIVKIARRGTVVFCFLVRLQRLRVLAEAMQAGAETHPVQVALGLLMREALVQRGGAGPVPGLVSG